MTSVNDIFSSSETLSAEDLQNQDVVLTIKQVEVKEFTDDGNSKRKPIIHFHETEKRLVANMTNSFTIADHHGDNLDNWPGKQITLYPTTTDFGGRRVPCIRIRPPAMGSHVSHGLPGTSPDNHPDRPIGGMSGQADAPPWNDGTAAQQPEGSDHPFAPGGTADKQMMGR